MNNFFHQNNKLSESRWLTVHRRMLSEVGFYNYGG